MGTSQAAETHCAESGARLYHLRSTASIQYFKNSEKYHMGELGLFPYAPTRGHISLGMKYVKNMPTASGDDFELFYR